jgi:hypothetical protein
MGRSRGKKRKEKVVKLGIKEKRKEKGEEERSRGRKFHMGNKWCKIMRIYSKEMKTIRRRVEDAMKEKTSIGEQEKEEQEIRKRRWRMGKQNPKTRWKM